MDLEMPTVEAIRKMVQRNEGVAFLPAQCRHRGTGARHPVRSTLKEMLVDRKIRLIYPPRRR